MGDMLDPDTEMLGDVAGELVANYKKERALEEDSAKLVWYLIIGIWFLFDFDELTDLKSVDNDRIWLQITTHGEQI